MLRTVLPCTSLPALASCSGGGPKGEASDLITATGLNAVYLILAGLLFWRTLLAARERHSGGATNRTGVNRPLTVYGSAQTHSSLGKAVRIAGLGTDQLRTIAVDAATFAMRPDLLEQAKAQLEEILRQMREEEIERTLAQLYAFFEEHNYKKKKLIPFFSMVQRQKKLHRESMKRVSKQYRKTLSAEIPFSSDIEKMGIHRAPVASYAGGRPAAKASASSGNALRSRRPTNSSPLPFRPTLSPVPNNRRLR